MNTPEDVAFFKKMSPFMDETCWNVFESWHKTIMNDIVGDVSLRKTKLHQPLFYWVFKLEDIVNPTNSITGWGAGDFKKYPLKFLLTNIRHKEASEKIKRFYVFPNEQGMINGFPTLRYMRIFTVFQNHFHSRSYMPPYKEFSSVQVRWTAVQTAAEASVFQKKEGYALGEAFKYPEIELTMQ